MITPQFPQTDQHPWLAKIASDLSPKLRRARRRLNRFWKAQSQRIVASILVVTFTITMTGLDKLVYAFEDRHDRTEDSLHAPSNPLADAAANQFMDSYSPIQTSTQTGPQLTDTSLNVLKAEYGDLLDTTSLQTVAERAASGMSIDSAVNLLVADQQPATGSVLPAHVELPEGQTGAPADNPTAMADAVTLGQGPLALSLNLGQEGTAEIPAESIAELPSVVPGADGKELPVTPSETQVATTPVDVPDAPTTETDVVATTTDQTNLPGTDVPVQGTNNQQDATAPTQTNTDRPETAGAPQPDENQTNQPVANIPDKPDDGTTMVPGDEETAPKEETDGKSLKEELAALLGGEEEITEEGAVTVASLTRPGDTGEDMLDPEVTTQPVPDSGEESGRVDPSALLPTEGETDPTTIETGETDPTEASPTLADLDTDRPAVDADTETEVADDETPVQNTDDVNPNSNGHALVGPETTDHPETDPEVTAAATTRVDGSSPTVDVPPVVNAANVANAPTGNYVQVQPQMRNMTTVQVASLNTTALPNVPTAPTSTSTAPNFNLVQAAGKGIQLVTGTQPSGMPTTLQDYRTTQQTTTIDLGWMGSYSFTQNVTAMTTVGQMPKPPTIVDVAQQIAAAANQQSSVNIPPQPTGATTPTFSPWTGERSAQFPPTDYSGMYAHPDPPENGGKEPSKCAKFMGSIWGKLIMFVVSVVLTIVTFGSAAPVVIAIMIILMAIQTFVPMPAWLSIALSVLIAACGGWAAGISAVSSVAVTTITEAVKLLANPTVIASIIKAVIADIIVQVYIALNPNSPVWLTAAVSVAAGVVASGFAEAFKAIFDPKDTRGFFTALVDGLKKGCMELIGFRQAGGSMTINVWTVIASPLMITLVSTTAELVTMEAMGGDESRFVVGALVGAAASGAFAMTGNLIAGPPLAMVNKQPWGGKQVFNTIMATMVRPLISKTIEAWYNANVVPYSMSKEGGGYNAVQSRWLGSQFAQGIAAMMPQFDNRGKFHMIGMGAMYQDANDNMGYAAGTGTQGRAGVSGESGDGAYGNNNNGQGVGAASVSENDTLPGLGAGVKNQGTTEVPTVAETGSTKTESQSGLPQQTGEVRSDNMSNHTPQQKEMTAAQNAGGTTNKQTVKAPEAKTDQNKPIENPNRTKTPDAPVDTPDQQQSATPPPTVKTDSNQPTDSPSLSAGERMVEIEMPNNQRSEVDTKPEVVKDANVKIPGKPDAVGDGTGQRRDGDVPKVGGSGTEGGNQGGDGSNGGNAGGQAGDGQGNQPLNMGDAMSQLKQMSSDGKVPAGFQPGQGGKASSLADNTNNGTVQRMLNNIGGQAGSDWQVIQTTNGNGNQLTMITSGPDANGQTTVLAASLQMGNENATLVFKPGANGTTTAQAFLGDQALTSTKVDNSALQLKVKDVKSGLGANTQNAAGSDAGRNLTASETTTGEAVTTPTTGAVDPRVKPDGTVAGSEQGTTTDGTVAGTGTYTAEASTTTTPPAGPVTMKTPDGTEIQVEYDPSKGPIQTVSDGHGNKYRVQFNGSQPTITGKMTSGVGDWRMTFDAVQTVDPTTGALQNRFEVMGADGTPSMAYTMDSKGNYQLTDKPYFVQQGAQRLHAVLPIADMESANATPQMRDSAVLAANANLPALQNNQSVMMDLRHQGLVPGTEAFTQALKSLAGENAQNAVNLGTQAYTGATTPEMKQAAANVLATAEHAQLGTFESKTSAEYRTTLTSFAGHALEGTNTNLKVEAAHLQVQAGDMDGAISTASQMYQQVSASGTASQKIDAGLNAMEVYRSSGNQGQLAAQNFTPTLDGLVDGQSLNIGQAARYDTIKGNTGNPTNLLAATSQASLDIAGHIGDLSRVDALTIPGKGTLTKQSNGDITYSQFDGQIQTSVTFKPDGTTVETVMVADSQGLRQTYTVGETGLRLNENRVTVSMKIDGKEVKRDLLLQVNQKNPDARINARVVEDSKVYLAKVDPLTGQAELIPIDANSSVTAGTFRDMPTFKFENGQLVASNGQRMTAYTQVTAANVGEIALSLASQSGQDLAAVKQQLAALSLEGKSVYLMGNTLVVGTAEGIQAGNYQAIKLEVPRGGTEPLIYQSFYSNGQQTQTMVRDGRVILDLWVGNTQYTGDVVGNVQPTLTFDGQGNLQAINGQGFRAYNAVNEADLVQIKADMRAAGMTDAQITQQLAALNLEGKSVYQVGSTIFVGTLEQLKAGDYQVAGMNKFQQGHEAVMYIATFDNNKLKSVDLSDHRMLRFKDGNPQNFVLTYREGTREYVAEYENGQIVQSQLTLTDLKVTLKYDEKGNLTNYAELAANPNFQTAPQGFTLGDQLFSQSGRMLMKSEGGAGGGQQEIFEETIKRRVDIYVAAIDQPSGVRVGYDEITNVNISLSIGEDGNVTKTVTASTELGLPKGPQKTYELSVDGRSSRLVSIQEQRTVTFPDGETGVLNMTRRAEANAPWTATHEGRSYTMDQSGKLVQTGWQETKTITMANGRTVSMVMSKGMEPNAPWTGELYGKVYALNPDGTLIQTAENQVGTAMIGGSEYRVTMTRSVGVKGDVPAPWTYTVGGMSYRVGQDNRPVPVSEQRYAWVNGQSVVISRDATRPDAPWSYTDSSGNTFRQLADGQYKQVSEQHYEVVNGKSVLMTRDTLRKDSPWSYTTANGDTYRETAPGKFTRISESSYMLVNGESVMATRDVTHANAGWNATAANGDVYVEIDGQMVKTRTADAKYTVIDGEKVVLMYDALKGDAPATATNMFGDTYTEVNGVMVKTREASREYVVMADGERVIPMRDAGKPDAPWSATTLNGDTYSEVNGKLMLSREAADAYVTLPNGEKALATRDAMKEGAAWTAQSVYGDSYTEIAGEMVRTRIADSKYFTLETGEKVLRTRDGLKSNSPWTATSMTGDSYSEIGGKMVKTREAAGNYTVLPTGEKVLATRDALKRDAPWTATSASGDSYTEINGKMVKTREAATSYTLLPNGERVLATRDAQKANAPWTAQSAYGDSYTEINGKMVMTRVAADRYTTLPTGEKVLATRDVHSRSWTAQSATGDTYTLTNGQYVKTRQAADHYTLLSNGERVLGTRDVGANGSGAWTATDSKGNVWSTEGGKGWEMSREAADHYTTVANGERVLATREARIKNAPWSATDSRGNQYTEIGGKLVMSREVAWTQLSSGEWAQKTRDCLTPGAGWVATDSKGQSWIERDGQMVQTTIAKYETLPNGERVLYTKPVDEPNAPWTARDLKGNVWTQKEVDGRSVMVKTVEAKASYTTLPNGQKVQFTRAIGDPTATWTATDLHGNVWALNASGRPELKAVSGGYVVVNGERVMQTRDAKNPLAPYTATDSKGNVFMQQSILDGKGKPTGRSEMILTREAGHYTVLENGEHVLLTRDAMNTNAGWQATDSRGQSWAMEKGVMVQKTITQAMTVNGETVMASRDKSDTKAPWTAQDSKGNQYLEVGGTMQLNRESLGYEILPNGQHVMVTRQVGAGDAAREATDYKGNSYTEVNGTLQLIRKAVGYEVTARGEHILMTMEANKGNAAVTGSDSRGNSYAKESGRLVQTREGGGYTVLENGEHVLKTRDMKGSAWTVSDRMGNQYTEVAGKMVQTRESAGYILYNGEHVMKTRDVTKDGVTAFWEFTSLNGNSFREKNAGKGDYICVRIAADSYITLASGEKVLGTRENMAGAYFEYTTRSGDSFREKAAGSGELIQTRIAADHYITLSNGEKVLPTKDVAYNAPFEYTTMDGTSHVEKVSGEGKYRITGTSAYQNVQLLDEKGRPTGETATLLMSKGNGAKDQYAGGLLGKQYTRVNDGGEAVLTSVQKFMNIQTESGERVTVMATRDMLGAKDEGYTYTYQMHVYKETANGSGKFDLSAKQEYKTVALHNGYGDATGERATILMSKSEEFRAEWTGSIDGKSYTQMGEGKVKFTSENTHYIILGTTEAGTRMPIVINESVGVDRTTTTVTINGMTHEMGAGMEIYTKGDKFVLWDDRMVMKEIDTEGIETTAYLDRVANTVGAAIGRVGDVWNKAMNDTSPTLWGDLGYALSLIGTTALGILDAGFSWVTSLANMGADACRRYENNTWAAIGYGVCKFIANNIVMLAAMAIGGWFGMALMLASLTAEMHAGIFHGALNFGITMLVQSVHDAVVGTYRAINGKGQSAFRVADNLVLAAGGIVDLAFSVKQTYDSIPQIKKTLKTIRTGIARVQFRFSDIGRMNPSKLPDGIRGAVMAVMQSALTSVEKIKAVTELVKGERPVAEVMQRHGLEVSADPVKVNTPGDTVKTGDSTKPADSTPDGADATVKTDTPDVQTTKPTTDAGKPRADANKPRSVTDGQAKDLARLESAVQRASAAMDSAPTLSKMVSKGISLNNAVRALAQGLSLVNNPDVAAATVKKLGVKNGALVLESLIKETGSLTKDAVSGRTDLSKTIDLLEATPEGAASVKQACNSLSRTNPAGMQALFVNGSLPSNLANRILQSGMQTPAGRTAMITALGESKAAMRGALEATRGKALGDRIVMAASEAMTNGTNTRAMKTIMRVACDTPALMQKLVNMSEGKISGKANALGSAEGLKANLETLGKSSKIVAERMAGVKEQMTIRQEAAKLASEMKTAKPQDVTAKVRAAASDARTARALGEALADGKMNAKTQAKIMNALQKEMVANPKAAVDIMNKFSENVRGSVMDAILSDSLQRMSPEAVDGFTKALKSLNPDVMPKVKDIIQRMNDQPPVGQNVKAGAATGGNQGGNGNNGGNGGNQGGKGTNNNTTEQTNTANNTTSQTTLQADAPGKAANQTLAQQSAGKNGNRVAANSGPMPDNVKMRTDDGARVKDTNASQTRSTAEKGISGSDAKAQAMASLERFVDKAAEAQSKGGTGNQGGGNGQGGQANNASNPKNDPFRTASERISGAVETFNTVMESVLLVRPLRAAIHMPGKLMSNLAKTDMGQKIQQKMTNPEKLTKAAADLSAELGSMDSRSVTRFEGSRAARLMEGIPGLGKTGAVKGLASMLENAALNRQAKSSLNNLSHRASLEMRMDSFTEQISRAAQSADSILQRRNEYTLGQELNKVVGETLGKAGEKLQAQTKTMQDALTRYDKAVKSGTASEIATAAFEVTRAETAWNKSYAEAQKVARKGNVANAENAVKALASEVDALAAETRAPKPTDAEAITAREQAIATRTEQVLKAAELTGQHMELAKKALEGGNVEFAAKVADRVSGPQAKALLDAAGPKGGQLLEAMTETGRRTVAKEMSVSEISKLATEKVQAANQAEALASRFENAGGKAGTAEQVNRFQNRANELRAQAARELTVASDMLSGRSVKELIGSKPGEGILANAELRKAVSMSENRLFREAMDMAGQRVVGEQALQLGKELTAHMKAGKSMDVALEQLNAQRRAAGEKPVTLEDTGVSMDAVKKSALSNAGTESARAFADFMKNPEFKNATFKQALDAFNDLRKSTGEKPITEADLGLKTDTLVREALKTATGEAAEGLRKVLAEPTDLGSFNAARKLAGQKPVSAADLGLQRGQVNRNSLNSVTTEANWRSQKALLETKFEIKNVEAQLAKARQAGDVSQIKSLTKTLDKLNATIEKSMRGDSANLAKQLRQMGLDANLMSQAGERALGLLDKAIVDAQAKVKASETKGDLMDAKANQAAVDRLQTQRQQLQEVLGDRRGLNADKYFDLEAKIKTAEGRGDTATVERLKPQRDAMAKLLSDPAIMEMICKAEGVDSRILSASKATSDAYKVMIVEMLDGIRDLQKTGKASPEAIDAALDNVLAKHGEMGLDGQQAMMVKELAKAFQEDPAYRNFNIDPLQQAFLSRVLELHVLNFELHGKANSLVRSLAGQEAILLAMGGGKSAGVLSLELARNIYKTMKGVSEAPASIYVTAVDALVKSIVNEGPMKRLAAEGKLVVIDEANIKDIIKNGLEADKVYVMSNEGVKKIVLEMRGDGVSDAQIKKFFEEAGTVAWDEFHSAFHTTDTILGSTGIWDYLSPQFKAEMRPVMAAMVDTYVKALSVLHADLAFNDGALRRVGTTPGEGGIFKGAESGPKTDIRNQVEFNLDYMLMNGSGETLGQALKRAGIDITSDGNMNLLRKTAQAMYEMNGRELTGGVRMEKYQIKDAHGNVIGEAEGARPWYGTAEKGVGKLNTIKGDPFASGLTLIDIMFKHEITQAAKSGRQFDFSKFDAKKYLADNPLFEQQVGEALAHCTTERVTMLEAVEFLGTQKIVGYSGTLEGLSKTLNRIGKDITAVSPEPVIGFDLVARGELHLSFMLDGKLMVMEGNGKSVSLEMRKAGSLQDYLMERSRNLSERGYSQQVYTHNDNAQLRGLAERAAAEYGIDNAAMRAALESGQAVTTVKTSRGDVSVVHITEATLRADVKSFMEKGMTEGKAIEAAVAKALETRSNKQVVLVDGMTPEAYSAALEGLKDAIHRMPKIADVLKSSSLPSEVRASLQNYLDANPKAKLRDWMSDTGVKYNNPGLVEKMYQAVTKDPTIRSEFGWLQERQMFAPSIGEGLNIFAAVDGLRVDGLMGSPFKGSLVKMDISPTDVFAQAMKRGNVTDEATGNFKRVLSDTGLDLDISRINNLTDVELGRFREFMSQAESGKINMNDPAVQHQFKALFDEVMTKFLDEIDVNKAGEIARTRAGQLSETESVSVAKTSPEYMPKMAEVVMQKMGERLREFQSLSDLSAARNANTGASRIVESLGGRNVMAMRTLPIWAKTSPVMGRVVSTLTAPWHALAQNTSALKADAQRISLVQQYAKAYQDPQWQSQNAQQVAEYTARYGNNWYESAMMEKFGGDYKFYQKLGEIQSSGSLLSRAQMHWEVFRQASTVKSSYYQAVQDMQKVAEMLPTLTRESGAGAVITWKGNTMNLTQAQNYVQQRLATTSVMAQRYGFKQTEGFKAVQQLSFDEVQAQAGKLGTAINTQLYLQSPLDRHVLRPVSQAIHSMNQALASHGIPAAQLLKMGGLIAAGITAVSIMGISSLVSMPALIAGAGSLGLMAMKKVSLPQAEGGIMGKLAGMSGLLGKTNSGTMGTVIAVGSLAVGSLMNMPYLVTAGLVSSIPALIGFAKNYAAARKGLENFRPEPDQPVLSYADAGQPVQSEATTTKGVVEAWQESQKTGQESYPALQEVFSVFGVDFAVGANTRQQGALHLMAALFDLIPVVAVPEGSKVVPKVWSQMREKVSIGKEAGLKALRVGEAGKEATNENAIEVNQQGSKFFNQSMSERMIRQLCEYAKQTLFTDAEIGALQVKLTQPKSKFRNYGPDALAELIRQYVMNGKELRDAAAIDAELDAIYKDVKRKFGGKEFSERDLIELSAATAELENESATQMKAMADAIASLQSPAWRVIKTAEFDETFAPMTYEAYRAMHSPSYAQRLLQGLGTTEKIEQSSVPVAKARTVGTQVAGFGAGVLLAGGVLIGAAVAVAAPAAMIVLAVTGALFGISGLVLGALGIQIRSQSAHIAFSLNPASTVKEQMANASFRSARTLEAMAAMAREIRENPDLKYQFEADFGLSYDIYRTNYMAFQTMGLPKLMKNKQFARAVDSLKLKGASQTAIREEMRTAAIEQVLVHLSKMADLTQSMTGPNSLREQSIRDAVQILAMLDYKVDLENPMGPKVTLTPEPNSRAIVIGKYSRLGRSINLLKDLGIVIATPEQPMKRAPKLKLAGSAA